MHESRRLYFSPSYYSSQCESAIKNLHSVLDKIDIKERTPVYPDKGYCSEENKQYLQSRMLKSRIQHKATKGKLLSEREQWINKGISEIRYKVEHTFGSVKRWFKSSIALYKGKSKKHSQFLLEAISYNLYRQPIVG